MFSFSLINDLALKKHTPSGISKEELDVATKKAKFFTQEIISNQANIALLNICNNDEQINIAKKVAKEINTKYKKLVIFGIGGSSFGGQSLCGSKFYKHLAGNIEISFIDNLYYHNFNIFLDKLNYLDTAFLTISKSGSTVETLSQILVTTDFFKDHIEKYGANNFYFLTEDTNNPLKKIATSLKQEIIPHQQKIGGRYSCFTSVALIPAFLANINLQNYVQGGKNIVDDFLNNKNSLVVQGASLLYAIMQRKISNHVFIPYLQRLYETVFWYSQLFAESLGKNNIGMTPIKAIGSVDQHSQLQLYLDGPKDKFFTFITQNTKNIGNIISVPKNMQKTIDFLDKNKLGDVINANCYATIESLSESDCLIREIRFKKFSDKAMGEFLMFLMLETILLGYMLEIDPFSQPAVEVGKEKARNILRKNSNTKK